MRPRILFLPRAERAERELQGVLDTAALEQLETKCPGRAEDRSQSEVKPSMYRFAKWNIAYFNLIQYNIVLFNKLKYNSI